MFEGLHGALTGKSDKAPKLTDIKGAHLIAKVTALLANEKRQDLIAKYSKLLSLSVENYKNYCQSLLNNFADFVQELPETQHSYYAYPGGLLDHALARTAIALSLVRHYFLPSGSEDAPLTQPQTLWAYAVFSAALLHDIGKCVVDLQVKLYDRQHSLLGAWSPFDGVMGQTATYYKYDFEKNYPDNFRKQVTVLLARQLMPAIGFRWIASNNDVLATWLAMLFDDKSLGGTFGPILLRADALSIGQYFDGLRAGRDYGRGGDRQSHFGFTHPGSEFATEAKAYAFLQWIYNNLENGRLQLGDPSLHLTEDGLLITDKLIKRYADEKGTSKGEAALTKDSLMKFLESESATGKVTSHTYLDVKNNLTVEGFMLSKFDLAIPAALTAEVLRNSPMLQANLINVTPATPTNPPQYIAPNGQLVAQPAATPAPLPEPTPPQYR